ncbi:MAG: hypothetical protein WCK29_00920 [archaeon]
MVKGLLRKIEIGLVTTSLVSGLVGVYGVSKLAGESMSGGRLPEAEERIAADIVDVATPICYGSTLLSYIVSRTRRKLEKDHVDAFINFQTNELPREY